MQEDKRDVVGELTSMFEDVVVDGEYIVEAIVAHEHERDVQCIILNLRGEDGGWRLVGAVTHDGNLALCVGPTAVPLPGSDFKFTGKPRSEIEGVIPSLLRLIMEWMSTIACTVGRDFSMGMVELNSTTLAEADEKFVDRMLEARAFLSCNTRGGSA